MCGSGVSTPGCAHTWCLHTVDLKRELNALKSIVSDIVSVPRYLPARHADQLASARHNLKREEKKESKREWTEILLIFFYLFLQCSTHVEFAHY
jgi:hypothetical protein